MLAGVIVVAAVLVLATAGALALRRHDGRFTRGRRTGAGQARGGRSLTGADLGRPLGSQATLLQFSSSFCAPCRAARQLLSDVAARSTGVAHVEIDVADRLDLARLLDVRRTPTLFVLGPKGQITGRASGVPRRDDVMAAVTLAAGGPVAGAGK